MSSTQTKYHPDLLRSTFHVTHSLTPPAYSPTHPSAEPKPHPTTHPTRLPLPDIQDLPSSTLAIAPISSAAAAFFAFFDTGAAADAADMASAVRLAPPVVVFPTFLPALAASFSASFSA